MNKKGNVYSVVLISFILFAVGMIMVNFIKPLVADTRTELNCSSPATDGTKIMCLNVDIALIYFIIIVMSLAGGIITDKFLL